MSSSILKKQVKNLTYLNIGLFSISLNQIFPQGTGPNCDGSILAADKSSQCCEGDDAVQCPNLIKGPCDSLPYSSKKM